VLSVPPWQDAFPESARVRDRAFVPFLNCISR
jgi:hypothetical protein